LWKRRFQEEHVNALLGVKLRNYDTLISKIVSAVLHSQDKYKPISQQYWDGRPGPEVQGRVKNLLLICTTTIHLALDSLTIHDEAWIHHDADLGPNRLFLEGWNLLHESRVEFSWWW
jgi:hypothetical protein